MSQTRQELEAAQAAFWQTQSVQGVVSQSQASQHKDCSPLPPVDLPDLVAAPPVGTGEEEPEVDPEPRDRQDEAGTSNAKRGAPRRSVAAMQLDMYSRGAQFFRFDEPSVDPKGRAIQSTPAHKSGIEQYR